MKKQYSFEGLNLDETREIFKKYRLGKISINDLVEGNMGLVKKIIISIYNDCNFKGANFDYDDLFQEGCISLYKAISKYDEDKDFKFSTYAYSVIKNDLLNIFFKNFNSISASRNSVTKAIKIHSYVTLYIEENKKHPTISEIAKSLDISLDSVQALYNLGLEETRLEKFVHNSNSNDKSVELKYFIGDDVNVEDEVINDLFKTEVMDIINQLDEKSKNMVLYRYGFVDDVCHTLEEIAEKEGITRQAVSQKEKKILTKCKKLCLKNGLQEFLN